MPNQLSIPFKKTTDIAVRASIRKYISERHNDTHPDALKWDISLWESLRKDGVGGQVHVDRVLSAQIYHAQLIFILTKLPSDIGLDIPYYPAFSPSGPPVTLRNLAYERAAVLFNLAALCSQLAAAEDRASPQGLKQAIASYQNAAGTMGYLLSTAIPKLRTSIAGDTMPLELSEAFIGHLESLMLAQAQECVWQRAVMDSYKNGVIAKLAKSVAAFYESSLSRARDASPSIRHLLPSGWIVHLETKYLHFEAAAQIRKSIDDLEANRYGHELARLALAQSYAQKGYDLARRAAVAPAVLSDIKSVLDNVQKNFNRAERDNDLIYHQDVPPAPSLPAIQEARMVQSLVAKALLEPKTLIKFDAAIFGELLGWGARRAIDIYKDRRQTWLRVEVVDKAQQLDDTATETLRTLNLPGSLEALEKPIGLPPSLLKKAEEVRSEKGPERIESSIEGVQRLAQQNMDTLNEAMDILDQEAEEDEQFRSQHATHRVASHEANQELISKAERYRGVLEHANESDEIVRTKWDEWETNVTELTWDEADLETSIPSSTATPSTRLSKMPNSTQAHARALRVALESLDDVQRSRREQVARATRLADAEDITPRILKAASGFEQWVEVQPAMLEDVLEEELAKYEKFAAAITEGEAKQESLLATITERNELFLRSRKGDPIVKEREHALQSLDLAYHKYKEITRNLDEGLKFYNDFASILTQFRESCKEWVNVRRRETLELAESMRTLSLDPTPDQRTDQRTHATSNGGRQTDFNPGLDLPPPDSDEWETTPLPPPPPPTRGSWKSQQAAKARR
ncbi:pH-response regulator protein palA/rim20 [Steccherinum ochraceum]|uniref:pH-response regulator protein palA/rim20 n=1 Tax=Steccherinum ochraceum TaxID=92696 RepID=A0A4R0RSM4_9APHY|nr:pH-response regulator protein palA/rim20 [Steccherinum ochraceum]